MGSFAYAGAAGGALALLLAATTGTDYAGLGMLLAAVGGFITSVAAVWRGRRNGRTATTAKTTAEEARQTANSTEAEVAELRQTVLGLAGEVARLQTANTVLETRLEEALKR